MSAIQQKIATDSTWLGDFTEFINDEAATIMLKELGDPKAPFRLALAYYNLIWTRKNRLQCAAITATANALTDGVNYDCKKNPVKNKQAAASMGYLEEYGTVYTGGEGSLKRAPSCGGGDTSYTLPNMQYCNMRVRNQGRCGSCWAHAVAQMLTIGFCTRNLGNYSQADFHMFASTQNLSTVPVVHYCS
jgi:hypothetical protein